MENKAESNMDQKPYGMGCVDTFGWFENKVINKTDLKQCEMGFVDPRNGMPYELARFSDTGEMYTHLVKYREPIFKPIYRN